ncbi:MAG: VIT domain-containing protein, partial [Burkholderiales bacterium]
MTLIGSAAFGAKENRMEASGDRSRVRPIVVDFLATLFYIFCIGVGTAVALGACVVLLAGEARGTEIVPMKAAEAQQGTLLLERAPGETFAAPLLRTEVAIKVSGMVARARVRQSFRNPFTDWLEGVYVFPLPENAAVDHLRMKVGERSVEGEIRERGQAKRNYEQAKRGGRRAALLEQERPNLFTSSVANIGPNDEIVVEIEYQQTLRYDTGRFSLRFPMAVGPRYLPGFLPVAGEPGTGWGRNTSEVPDAARITPPVLRPSQGPVNPVSIRVELDAGVPLADIDSPYHEIRSRVLDTGREVVELERGAVPANRDFELVWTPAAQSAPRAAWFAERRG